MIIIHYPISKFWENARYNFRNAIIMTIVKKRACPLVITSISLLSATRNSSTTASGESMKGNGVEDCNLHPVSTNAKSNKII